MSIGDRMNSFKTDLTEHPVSVMVQKYITYGDCYVLNQAKYFELKSKIATEFDLHPSQVLIVGSAKLGFSIVEGKRYRPFGDTSDIDVAIVSPILFDAMWTDVFDYWRMGGYWPELDKFRKYLFRGWLRPDKLPPEKTFERGRKWWEFFRILSSSQAFGPFAIKAGLYKAWYFLESYQSQCVGECRQETEGHV